MKTIYFSLSIMLTVLWFVMCILPSVAIPFNGDIWFDIAKIYYIILSNFIWWFIALKIIEHKKYIRRIPIAEEVKGIYNK